MPLLVNSVPNLAQGVSQQPDTLRYPGQCDEQINAWSTVVEGLKKRPNTEYVKNIDSTSTESNLFTHFVKRDETNQYMFTVSLGGVGAIDLTDGTKISVATTSIANQYLSLGGSSLASSEAVSNPLADLRAMTVADYTFLVNKKRLVRTSKNTLSDIPSTDALIAVKLGDYEKAYNVYIDGTLVQPSSTLDSRHVYTTSHWTNHSGTVNAATYMSGPATGQASDRTGVYADTEHIAEDLKICIEDQFSTTRTGIAAITMTGSGSGSGWLDDDENMFVNVIYKTKSFGDVKTETVKKYIKRGNPKKLEFTVKQTVSGVTNRSAKGVCNVSNGVITEFIFTNKGSGYDTNTSGSQALELELIQKVYGRFIYTGHRAGGIDMQNKVGWVVAQNDTAPVAPTTSTLATTNVSPLVVNRNGSLLKLQKSQIVSNGGVYYLLQAPHLSSSQNEPGGSGADWNLYWSVITTSTSGAEAWQADNFYEFDEDIQVSTTDGLQNQGLGVIHKEVNSITDLPKKCYSGFAVKIIGDADINQDDYYVEFKTKDGQRFGEGSWIETVGWKNDGSETAVVKGIDLELAPETMPLIFKPVFEGQNIASFKLQTPQEDEVVDAPYELGWRVRKAGDDFSNPMPSFVSTEGSFVSLSGSVYTCIQDHRATSSLQPDTTTTHWTEVTMGIPEIVDAWEDGREYNREIPKTINDVFFFKNRLGFVTDNAVIFSEADEYFNFFRTTTQQLLDSAPIDVGLSHTKVAILQHAIPFQEKLMLFSKQSQFVLRGADVLSPKTVAISPVTEYDISDSVEPVALGNYIYFTFKRNDFEGMYEYFVDNNTEVFDAEEITQQVPKYIPNNVRKIAGSQAENTLIVGVDSDLKTLYVYKYFWSNKEKVQSAWMKFSFDRDVVGFDFIDSKLYMVTKDTEGLHLEYLTLEDGLTDEGLDYSLLLDSRVDGSDVTVSVYNPTTKKTRISNIPYNVSLGTDIELYTKIGTQRAITMVDDTTVDVTGTIASYVDDGSGDYVTYEGDTYYCIKAHTSSSTFESINWRKSTTTPSGTLAWASSTSYSAGILYKCIVTHTSAEGDDLSTSSNWATTTDVTAATIWSSGRLYNDDTYFFIGKPYTMTYRFSDQSLKQPTERGGRSASDYTFQTIRNGSINYADTGHFTVEVTPEYRDTYSYVFNPDIVGADLSLNEFKPQSGHFRFAVQARPNEVKIEVKSASALPCKLLAAEFESLFVPRSRRYGS